MINFFPDQLLPKLRLPTQLLSTFPWLQRAHWSLFDVCNYPSAHPNPPPASDILLRDVWLIFASVILKCGCACLCIKALSQNLQWHPLVTGLWFLPVEGQNYLCVNSSSQGFQKSWAAFQIKFSWKTFKAINIKWEVFSGLYKSLKLQVDFTYQRLGLWLAEFTWPFSCRLSCPFQGLMKPVTIPGPTYRVPSLVLCSTDQPLQG